MLVQSKYFRAAPSGGSLRTNLRASMGDGAAFGVMVGVGETYFPAFALAIGLGEVAAGLISSVPMLAGGLLQLVSLRAVQWLGSEKRWVLLCASVQALAFVPLAIAGFLGTISMTTMLVVASVYWAAGLASGPAWNTWMQSIVPSRIRAKYFAGRTRTSQFTTLSAFLGGGMLLQWSRGADLELLAFAGLFLAACLFRLVSVACLAQQRIAIEHSVAVPRSIAGTINNMRETGWRLLVFLVVMQGMVQISGPFFSPYLLEQLDYSYTQFVLLIGIAFLSKGIAFSVWAKVASRRGARWLLWVGGLGIVPIAGLWCISQNFAWLLLAQVISGTVWAAYELGFFLLFFETLPVHKRTRMLTIYNFGNTAAWCLGAAAGAAVLARLGAREQTYFILFAVSSLGRLLAIGFLMRALPPSLKLRIPVRNIGVRVLGLRPSSGGVDMPILPSIPSPSGRMSRHSA
jgi:MFS family permease